MSSLYTSPDKIMEVILSIDSRELQNRYETMLYAPYAMSRIINPEDNSPENTKKFVEIIKLLMQHDYRALMFYYVGYAIINSQWNTAKTCKEYLRTATLDIDQLLTYYLKSDKCDEETANILREASKDFLMEYVSNIREKQTVLKANESVLANYSPCIPYTNTLVKQNINGDNPMNDMVNNSPVFGNLTVEGLFLPSIQYTREIIENIHWVFSWDNSYAVFGFYKSNNGTSPMVKDYLASLWYLSNDPSQEIVKVQYNCFEALTNTEELSEESYKEIFENMNKTNNPSDIESLFTTEAWSALDDASQNSASIFLNGISKEENSSYDIDALLAKFYTMRHVEANYEVTQLILQKYPELNLSGYMTINSSIPIYELNNCALVIPYIDLAANYAVKFLVINKDNDIVIFSEDDIVKYSEKTSLE